MHGNENCETLLKRCVECEALAQSARDMSIRKKSAELAKEYRNLAEKMRQLDFIERSLADAEDLGSLHLR